ncbi:MAG: GNAT family N-acetyltransferase [Paracoccaceae bacterium]|nr:GNAT family N-acetyltransferase [Paracoccaceae bacterium]
MKRRGMALVKVIGAGDIDLLLGVDEGMFDHPIRPDQARAFLANPLNLMAVALEGSQIVSFASGTILLHPDKAPGFLVNEVGTRNSHQRQGLATAVCRALFDAARAAGCEGIWLGADENNAPAQALYRKLGGEALTIVAFGWDGAFDDD